ncbi:NAD(P)H-flavin reductase/hemoglobin-like flavoprotein [Streptomyces sp. V3I8]|uniref:globin domain-containing protein n=1 Tax=Streptomyces sp. V3I8 TaxID=3042279 RepID=UPI0027825F2F|nr:globin domain-containing protein [Streptomyces sp. V3I8]MDQ1037448.1 NAD(P)H-flavin reductase/hemoglobin-like flavoprotein [Streptomyces sp. V3I8]
MDAPTTTSADNGTSGGGGGGGWFTPHTPPDPPAGGGQEATEGRRLAGLRPVGRPAKGDNSPTRRRIPPHTEPGADTDRPDSDRSGPDRSGPDRSDPERSDAGHSGTDRSDADRAAVDSAASDTVSAPAPDTAPARPASPDAVLIRRTMDEVAPVADKVTSYFYALLFVRHPDLRPLFPAAMDAQRDRLLKALLTAAEHIDNTEILVAYLQNLGRGHRKYGTRPEHYPAVGECLLGALSRFAGTVWDREAEAAWVRAYTTISQIMIDAAAADELRAPAWWYAEVVSHDLRTPDVAVVTVRTDQPYPFLAGQYTSLETPWWPRVWRHYSFASAPRSDGLLSFHVKAVPAGWVSSALVHRARPGDIIRLGPPAGSMTVDHTTDSGLLCLGGGTGIAPIKALVEDVAEHGHRRPVEVFYGARTDHDLYDIDTMLRLQQSHSWLAVRPIVDQKAHLQLPDAVRESGPWNEYDAYLSGPPGMIRNGVDALRDIGVPSDRIRHDAVEDLVAIRD